MNFDSRTVRNSCWNECITLNMRRPFESHPWYHGFLCRERIWDTVCFYPAIVQSSDVVDFQYLRGEKDSIETGKVTTHSRWYETWIQLLANSLLRLISIERTKWWMDVRCSLEKLSENRKQRFGEVIGFFLPTGMEMRSLSRVSESVFRRSMISSLSGTF